MSSTIRGDTALVLRYATSMLRQPPVLSIVVEWENADRIGTSRADELLKQLRKQIQEAAITPASELIFVLSNEDSDTNVISQLVARHDLEQLLHVRYLQSPSGEYYAQKNFGAAAAVGDIIIFLDSDVIPQDGWLAHVLRPFSEENAKVVSGTSFIEVSGLYSAAMALGWIFPLRSDRAGVSQAPTFWANNVAFDAEIFRGFGFPETGQYRGQCIALAGELRSQGIAIYTSHQAAVGHPPPEGLAAFIVRALRRGHDEAASLRRRGRSPMLRGSGATGKALLSALARVWRNRRSVGLGPAGAAAASVIVSTNYVLQFAGLVAACAAPRATSRLLLGQSQREYGDSAAQRHG